MLIKPNVLGPWGGRAASSPTLWVVKALVAVLKEQGARVQVGTTPVSRGYGRMGKLAKETDWRRPSGKTGSTSPPRRRVPIKSRF